MTSSLGGKAKPTEDFFLQAYNPRTGRQQNSFGVREGSNDFRVRLDPSRNTEVMGISNTFGSQADQLGLLKQRVAPGFSALRQSRLDNIGDLRRRAIGDLSDNLQRRRISGSSFGMDALSRANAEFAREEDRIIAETELAEIEATNQLINQESTARANSYQTVLDELNTQLSTWLGFVTGAAPIFNQSAALAQNANQFGISSALNIGGTALGGFLTNKAINAGISSLIPGAGAGLSAAQAIGIDKGLESVFSGIGGLF